MNQYQVWKKTSTLVTKGRALLQIEKKGRASLRQGRALHPVKRGQREHCFRIRVILIVEDPTVTVKCRTAIKALLLHFSNVGQSPMFIYIHIHTVMGFYSTFNNISVILWRSILLVEKITDKLYHILLYRVHLSTQQFFNYIMARTS